MRPQRSGDQFQSPVTTTGAAKCVVFGNGEQHLFAGRGRSGRFPDVEQFPAQSQLLVAHPVGEESEAADADEPPGKDVLHEPPQELVCRESHPPPAVTVGVGFVTERDLAVRQGLEAVIADRHAIVFLPAFLQHANRLGMWLDRTQWSVSMHSQSESPSPMSYSLVYASRRASTDSGDDRPSSVGSTLN